MDAAMDKLHSLQFDIESTDLRPPDANRLKHSSDVTMSVTIVSPDKWRTEIRSEYANLIMVSDGKFIWSYDQLKKQYSRRLDDGGPNAVLSTIGVKIPEAMRGRASVRTLRSETIEVDGEKRGCWVIETPGLEASMSLPIEGGLEVKILGGTATRWIDKKLMIEVRTVTSTRMQMGKFETLSLRMKVWRNVRINEAIPDSVFSFIPPPDASEVETLSPFKVP
jgi:outer membrane lipoprotein-sorting protein